MASDVMCCTPAIASLDADRAQALAPLFKALGDPVRLRLASMIAAMSEVCVCELTTAFELSGPTISHHLKVLRDNGIVECERRGTWVYYWIRPHALAELTAVLAPLHTGA